MFPQLFRVLFLRLDRNTANMLSTSFDEEDTATKKKMENTSLKSIIEMQVLSACTIITSIARPSSVSIELYRHQAGRVFP